MQEPHTYEDVDEEMEEEDYEISPLTGSPIIPGSRPNTPVEEEEATPAAIPPAAHHAPAMPPPQPPVPRPRSRAAPGLHTVRRQYGRAPHHEHPDIQEPSVPGGPRVKQAAEQATQASPASLQSVADARLREASEQERQRRGRKAAR